MAVFNSLINIMSSIKILSWNMNGIKSTLHTYGGLDNLLTTLDSDIVCFQETKLPALNDSNLCISDKYFSYFVCNKHQQAYSGVATFVKKSFLTIKCQDNLSGNNNSQTIVTLSESDLVDIGLTPDELCKLDCEGRVLITGKLGLRCIFYVPITFPIQHRSYRLRPYQHLCSLLTNGRCR